MESELAGCSSGGVVSDVYNFNRAEMVVDRVHSPDFQNFVAYGDTNENMVFVPKSTTKIENSPSCDDEHLVEIKSVKRVPEGNEEEASDVYLSTGIFLHPLSLRGNYENIIELIDVDPNEKLDLGSPLPINESCTSNEVLDNQRYNMAFGCLVPINNGVVPFFGNYAKLPVNSELQSLQVIYNTPSTASNSPPEDLNLNHFAPKETKKTVPPFLRRNRKPKVAMVQAKLEPLEIETTYNEEDDVIFVKEWTLPIKLEKSHLNTSNSKQAVSAETTSIDNTNVEATTSPSSSPIATVRRHRRRRTFGEKRKNPVRKAQIDKASMDLAEKLAIPPSVFNARVKGRKPKQKVVVEMKNLRQSCRTSGAILSPPRTLTQYDYREWPIDGMHERPLYDESTNTIIKYHIPNATAVKNEQCARRPVLSEMPVPQVGESSNLSKYDSSLHVHKSPKRSTTNNIHSKEFAKISLDRLQLMFGYVQELKEFNRLAVAGGSSNQENQLRKQTLYEKSLEFRLYQNGIKENKLEKSFSKIIMGCKEENIKKVQPMLYDTCTLYSLASGVNSQGVADLVNSYAAKGRKWDRPQI